MFGKAVGYLLNQKAYLYNYLLDERLEASNNGAERSVKPFVIARKNFLFTNTPKGAEDSAVIFSLRIIGFVSGEKFRTLLIRKGLLLLQTFNHALMLLSFFTIIDANQKDYASILQ